MNLVKSKQRVADYGEVFTPTWMVDAMLDLVKDESQRIDSRFLEPACGSGNFLVRVLQRKLAAVEAKCSKSEFDKNNYSLLALMCIYGIELLEDNIGECRANLLEIFAGYLKLASSDDLYAAARQILSLNIVHGDTLTIIHTDNTKARLAEIWGENMQFDVIIGNPPYQLGQSGGEAVGSFAMPIYQEFVNVAKRLDPRFVVMVTPSRWFAGGRGLDEYRSEMLKDRRIRALVDFPDAREAFPGTQIKGGVSYFLWDNLWNDACEVTTIEGGKPTSPPTKRFLGAYDVLIRRNDAVPILEKVLKSAAKEGFGNLASKVSAIQPFSIRTNFRGSETSKGIKKPVRLIGNGGESFIERAAVPRNDAWIDEWKVLLGAAYGAGEGYPHQIYNHPIIAGPGTACSETYLVIDRFKSKAQAERFAVYLRTRFVRFLVSVRKYTQHLYNERFQFVPDLPMDQEWTDEDLYKKYGISTEEIAFINQMVRPMKEG